MNPDDEVIVLKLKNLFFICILIGLVLIPLILASGTTDCFYDVACVATGNTCAGGEMQAMCSGVGNCDFDILDCVPEFSGMTGLFALLLAVFIPVIIYWFKGAKSSKKKETATRKKKN